MSKYPGLKRRGNNYEIRKRVPSDLVDVLERTEITKALGTDTFNEAVKRYHVEMNKIVTMFEAERARVKDKQDNPDMLSTYSDAQLKRLAMAWLSEYEKSREEYKSPEVIKGVSQQDKMTDDEHVIELKHEINYLKQEIDNNTENNSVHLGATTAEKYLKRRDITFDASSKQFWKLAYWFSKSLLEYHQRALQKAMGKPFQVFDTMFANHGQVQAVSLEENEGKTRRTIGEVINEHLYNPSAPVGKKTLENYVVVIRLLEEQFGLDAPIHRITRDDCKAMRAILLKLPVNAGKKAKGITYKEAVKLGEQQGWTVLSPGTVNSYMSKMSALLNYAQGEGYILQNPCSKLLVKDKVKKKDKRHSLIN